VASLDAVSVSPNSDERGVSYELRFDSLFRQGKALSFPCSADGHVDLDALSNRSKTNYFGARALIGHDYSCPHVVTTRRS